MSGKVSDTGFQPIATPQGWFSWNSWTSFFATIFDTISRSFFGEPKSLSAVVPLPTTISPETLTDYLATNFTPQIPLAERAIEQRNTKNAGRIVDVLDRMKVEVESAIREDREHDYTLITGELAKAAGLTRRLAEILPHYPTVPYVESDSRVLPSFGLKNGGNTCFINTILQAVFVVPELIQHIVFAEGQHLIVRELFQTYKRVQEGGAFSSYPNLSTPLRSIVPQFEGFGQHDAFEFLLRVLVAPLKNPEKNPLFFNFEERCYYEDYETYQDQITEHFEEDGGRISGAGRGLHSSLQLVLSSSPFSTMEELIRNTLHEDVPKDPTSSGVAFLRGSGQTPVNLHLVRKHVKISPPPFLIVDFKRHSIASQQFREGGTFRGSKNTTPVAFTQSFFIPPEFSIDGKGAKYEWIALVNQGGGYGGGHYVADVRTSDGKYYEYSDTSKRELSEQDFLAAGKGCYGGFARRVECEDIQGEMEALQKRTDMDREIGVASHGKWGEERELSLIALFNKYLAEEEPSLTNLQKVYDQLSPQFCEFIGRFLTESPRDRLIELKGITKPLLVPMKPKPHVEEAIGLLVQEEEEVVATHIVAQYEQVRKQNRALAGDHRTQMERDLAVVQKQKALLEHLETLSETPRDLTIAAATLDPGLEKVIAIKGIILLLEENALERKVLEIRQINADIRAGRTH